MSVSIREWRVPGAALALAGSVALSAVPVLSPALPQPAPTIPAVRIADIQLAGIGQDIYYAITPWVQYAVGGVSYIVNFLPVIGGPIAAQININYFQGIQPVVEATVNALAGVVQDPLDFFGTLAAYGSTLYDIGYNWVSAQLQWLGLPPLPPLASVGGSSAPLAAARSSVGRPRAAAAVADPVATEVVAEPVAAPVAEVVTQAPVTSRGDLRRGARTPAVSVRAAAVEAGKFAISQVRSPARVSRGQVSRAAGAAHTAAGPIAEATD